MAVLVVTIAVLPTNLCKNFKLLPSLVKVDEPLVDNVGHGRVDHDEVGEEGAQVGDGAVADSLGVLLVLLEDLLQVGVVISSCGGKPVTQFKLVRCKAASFTSIDDDKVCRKWIKTSMNKNEIEHFVALSWDSTHRYTGRLAH